VFFDGATNTQGFYLQRPNFANSRRDGLPDGALPGHVQVRSEEQARYRMNDVLGIDPAGVLGDLEELPQQDVDMHHESEVTSDVRETTHLSFTIGARTGSL